MKVRAQLNDEWKELEYVPGADCPNCGQKVWDNRTNKKNPKGPDFKCSNKDECGIAMWIPKLYNKPTLSSSTNQTAIVAILNTIMGSVKRIEEAITKTKINWEGTDATQ